MTIIAYFITVLTWATTPLAIQWSGVGLHPLLGLSGRILIAVVLIRVLLRVLNISVQWDRLALKNYMSGGLGLAGGLAFVYVGAAFIPSGLISVLFGLSPAVSGLLAHYILGDAAFRPLHWVAFALALLGLGVLSYEQLLVDMSALMGVAMVLVAVFLFSLSGVLVKRYQLESHVISQTYGTLLFSLPVFLVLGLPYVAEAQWDQVPVNTFLAILYLAVAGSIVGMLSYFYILRVLSPASVALVTLMTPAIAMLLGALFNNEQVHAMTLVGVLFVLAGLGLYIWENLGAQKALVESSSVPLSRRISS